VTNIFDHELAPAKELAALYHERWEIETLFCEFKKSLRGARTVLRSKTPELVLQELWGLILVHFSLRFLMAESAWQVGLDPDRLSFMSAVRIIQCKAPLIAASPPRGIE
jgi:IS4 transposase